ncbi:MAG: sigma-70 family RNA polymerase sigma factor [Phycisphaerae bacterium]|nr:sigma-70 family RNA polymerase sigma factor [Phycisphaerae bacterium]
MKPHVDDNLTQRVQAAMGAHEAPLVRYATRMVSRAETARDIVQDTFLKMIEAETAPTDGKLPAWLFTVCRNKALDVLRKEKRMNLLNDNEQAIAATDPNPAEAVELGETSCRVLDALAQLPPNQREVLRLKYQNEFSYRQIAEITGHSVSNVGFLIHTGMTKLRRQFKTGGMIG